MRTFLFNYNYNGAAYSFEINAESLDEAWGRVRALRHSQIGYDGELGASIPAAIPGVGVLVWLVTRIMNLFRRHGGTNG